MSTRFVNSIAVTALVVLGLGTGVANGQPGSLINYDPIHLMADHDATERFHSRFAFSGRVSPMILGGSSFDRDPIEIDRLGWFTQWHPWRGGLHLSGALLYQDFSVSPSTDLDSVLGGRPRWSTDALLNHNAEGLTSYLGLGWATRFDAEKRFGMRVDMGLLSSDLNELSGSSHGGTTSNRMGFGRAFGDLDGDYVTPVFSLGMSYSF
ncbi:MAG: hypothetical protein ACFCUJ_09960 [Thiotrichales bacterium]